MLATGIDDPVPPKPKNSPATWVTPDDYPPAALRAEQTGSVGVLLTIDAAGRVADCTVSSSSGSSSLDDGTCSLIRARASYFPGRDANGHPVGGKVTLHFRWDIPPTEHVVPVWHRVATFSLDPGGAVRSCEDQPSAELPPFFASACTQFKARIPADVLAATGSADTSRFLVLETTMALGGAEPPAAGVDGAHLQLAFTVGEDGTVEHCEAVRASHGTSLPVKGLCGLLADPFGKFFTPERVPVKASGRLYVTTRREPPSGAK